MKKLILLISIFICNIEAAFTQSSTFDSAYILISSNTYDYRNPTFENNFDPYNMNSSDRLAYEIHTGSRSDLVIQKYDFNSEEPVVTIVSDSSKNVNPSFSYNMIVWQSNKYGRQDLFYSLYNGINWSTPSYIDTSEGDKIQPNIHFTGYSDIYCLSYQKENDIYFRYYRGGVWSSDTNLTNSIVQKCQFPVLWGRAYNMSILFLQNDSDSTKRIMKQSLQIQFPLYEIIFSPQIQIYSDQFIKNIKLSTGPAEEYINFEKDSSGNTDVIGYRLTFGTQIINYTSQYEGKCYNGKGSYGAMIFENNNLYNYFFCFSFINKSSDSTAIIVYRTKNSSNLISRKFYLGDTAVQTYSNISRPVMLFPSAFKIRLIWEQTVNGKIALYESNLIDQITSISSETIAAENFSLSQNYPNPFNPTTNLEFGIANLGFVSLKVYDILGNEIKTLVNENKTPGSYSVEFDGSNYSSGIYFYKLETENYSETKRMALIK